MALEKDLTCSLLESWAAEQILRPGSKLHAEEFYLMMVTCFFWSYEILQMLYVSFCPYSSVSIRPRHLPSLFNKTSHSVKFVFGTMCCVGTPSFFLL